METRKNFTNYLEFHGKIAKMFNEKLVQLFTNSWIQTWRLTRKGPKITNFATWLTKCVNSSWQAGGDWSSLCATSLLKMLIHLVSDVNTFCARMAYKQLKLSASNPRRISFLYKCIWRGFFWNLGENKIKEKSVTQLHYKSVFQLRPQLQNNQSLFFFFLAVSQSHVIWVNNNWHYRSQKKLSWLLYSEFFATLSYYCNYYVKDRYFISKMATPVF
jgi:hypothetical protein